MRIKSLSLQNFRCFGSEKLKVDFSQANYFVVVGPNGSGKSNLIEALRWGTGHRQISSDSVEPTDFNGCTTDQPILIEVELQDPIKYGDTFNRIHEIKFLVCTAREYVRGEEKGDLRTSSKVLDASRKDILAGQTIPKGKDKQFTEDEKAALQKPHPVSLRDIRGDVPVYFLDPSNYDYNLSTRRGTLLYNLSQILGSDLFRNDAMAEYGGQMRRRIDVIKELTEQIGSVLQSDKAESALSGAREFMAEQMELPKDALALNLSLPQGTELVSKLSLIARDGINAPPIPLENCGKGYSALAMVGLFQSLTLAQAKPGFVLLIEEPETFLAPTVRATFANQLRAFAEAGNQVIVVTHAPEFVDAYEPSQIVRLQRAGGSVTVDQWPSAAPKPTFDRSLKFVEPNLGKIMFARRLLFVEGADDVAAVRSALAIIGIDPAFHGLEIIRMEGKGNAATFNSYVKPFSIAHGFLLDKDAEANLVKFDPSGSTWRLFRPDLEGTLRTSKQQDNSSHVYTLVESCKDKAALQTMYPEFCNPLLEMLNLLGITVKLES